VLGLGVICWIRFFGQKSSPEKKHLEISKKKDRMRFDDMEKVTPGQQTRS